MVGIAEEYWVDLDGWAGAKGVDPLKMPMDRFLNLVYRFATEDAEQKEKDKFDVRLNKPDARAIARGAAQRDDSPWSKKNEEAALSGLVGALTGKA